MHKLHYFVISTLIGVTNPLAPHTAPQSLWRTTQQINALDAHTHHYGPVLVACTARDFLRGCAGVEAFSVDEHGMIMYTGESIAVVSVSSKC